VYVVYITMVGLPCKKHMVPPCSYHVQNTYCESHSDSFLFSLCVCLSVSLLAIILYRVPLTWSRRWCKLAHAGLLFMAVVLAVLGLCAAFDFHSANNIPHLYSLHSWTGISTVALFTLQVYHLSR